MDTTLKHSLITLTILAGLSRVPAASAQQARMAGGSSTMVGKESKAEFDAQNQKGAAAVGAVKATPAKLSAADQKLLMEVAKGGLMQLEVSKVAAQKATNPAVRQLAQAEVTEQTGLSAKLKEMATAKGITLPATPDAKTKALVTELQAISGKAFDKMYVLESGVKGHEKLDKVMTTVEASSADASLKGVGKAAHPLVKTHLKVAYQIMDTL
ncbi:DUF4142 domain-containing protein [Spirosoma pollinicola]|uniref:DUF4142 domain-containing protein n=1 Tax=Spirosoma pollinicola TaxID=2057025 RepID=A0A2K8Z9Q7_9BACT|nr:DUF4142 domain-containing protein [Spirosoma pollinicola]AUD06613.1 hypothetical protein CWM47_35060 [Spirosoma pollinicola]